ncbi:hypothetical protein B9T26_11010 [Acinetobacter sp. ANC 4169]|uniref:hypothetical protein n=1 Tax=Acinetobacter sp. ANC 4169 TaxID=1977879 RepID=UPI000A34BC3A|nr:hypothetical protein [Acinetobacter sp. ANC 4169]OTG71913.1 hypothetical protein B9T26_11010 [Acinetobacter sp. ANC 4169]
MIEKIQTKINELQAGKKLILGSGIEISHMQNIVDLCESLAATGVIKIVKINHPEQSGKKTADSIIIEKV